MTQQEVKDVKGISENECTFQGRVAEDPYITDQAAYLKLKTVTPEMGANGQIIDTVQTIPITFLDKGKIKVITDYVKKGKQLRIKAYYKSWEANGQLNHALVATQIKLGPDEYNPNANSNRRSGYSNRDNTQRKDPGSGFPFPA